MLRSHDRVSEDEGRRRVTGRAVHPTATPPFHCVSPRTLLASDGGELENGGGPENGDVPEYNDVPESNCDCASSRLAPAPAIVILRVKAMSMENSPMALCHLAQSTLLPRCGSYPLRQPLVSSGERLRSKHCSAMKRREVGVRQ